MVSQLAITAGNVSSFKTFRLGRLIVRQLVVTVTTLSNIVAVLFQLGTHMSTNCP